MSKRFSSVVLVGVCGVCGRGCNMTRYREWYESDYTRQAADEQLRVDRQAGFWGLSKSSVYFDYTMSFGIVMDKATRLCRQSLKQKRLDISGRHGDVHAYDIHSSMCSDYCVDSDLLHIEAMRQSGCDCLELSPSPSDVSYSREGEFCLENSGRILCDELDHCGVWNCRLGDFMCPRHEYNKRHTRFRGLGDCSSATSYWSTSHKRILLLAFSSACGALVYI